MKLHLKDIRGGGSGAQSINGNQFCLGLDGGGGLFGLRQLSNIRERLTVCVRDSGFRIMQLNGIPRASFQGCDNVEVVHA